MRGYDYFKIFLDLYVVNTYSFSTLSNELTPMRN